MRPPPRKRRKPEHLEQTQPEPPPQQQQQQRPPDRQRRWLRGEQRNLLSGLRSLSKTLGAQSDIDYARLRSSVPTRTEEEIRSMVETLKNQVITSAKVSLLKSRAEERRLRKPVETWTHLAAAVSGKLSEPISTAFSQMLIVSSTEPRTLIDSDPPVSHRPPPHGDGHVVPAAGKAVGATTTRRQVLKIPAPARGRAKTLPAPSQVVQVANPVPAPQQQPSLGVGTSPVATTSASTAVSNESTSNSTGPDETLTPPVPPPTPADPPPSSATPPLSAPPAALHAGFGGSSERPTEDDSEMFNVSFERIYRYLAAVHKPNQRSPLTPMESAIVLDLLMSLQEEIPQLPRKQLRQHLIQVYQSLSARADSEVARQMVEDLRRRRAATSECDPHVAGVRGGRAAPAATPPTRDGTQPDHTAVAGGGGREHQQGGDGSTEGSGNANVMGLCPPLNPFMIPLKLLMRR